MTETPALLCGTENSMEMVGRVPVVVSCATNNFMVKLAFDMHFNVNLYKSDISVS